MKADSAVSYRQATNESIEVRDIKIADKAIASDLNLAIDGVSKLEITISVDIKALLAETHLDDASKIHVVIDAICDNLRVRESVKSW